MHNKAKNELRSIASQLKSSSDLNPLTQVKLSCRLLKLMRYVFLTGEPVVSIHSRQIQPDEQGRYIKAAVNWFRQWLEDNSHSVEFENKELGTVIIAPAGIKSAMSHKPHPADVQALPALMEAIQKATVISRTNDDFGKPIENIILAAPILMDNVKYILGIRLRKYLKDTGELPRYYTQAVVTQKNTVRPNQTDKSFSRVGESGGRDRLLNVLHNALSVNTDTD